MYIYANPDVRRISVRDSQDEDPVVVEFDDDGQARVDKETGQYVAERVENITVEEETVGSNSEE